VSSVPQSSAQYIGYERYPERNQKMSVSLGYFFVLLFFVSAFGNAGLQDLNQFVLWVVTPIFLFFFIKEFSLAEMKISRSIYLYGGVILWSLVALPLVEDFDLFSRHFRLMLSNILLIFMCNVAIVRSGRIEHALRGLWVSALAIVIYNFLTGEFQLEDEYDRASGLAGNANGFGSLCRIGILCAFFLVRYEQSPRFKLLYYSSIIPFIYSIINTASRGSFANMVFVIICSLVYLGFGAKKQNILGLIVTVVIVIASYFIFASQFEETFLFKRLTRNESVNDAFETEARLLIYKRSWEVFLDHPVVGVGLHQIKMYNGGKAAHSEWLSLLPSLGIVGTSIYAIIYFSLIGKMVRIFKTYKETRVKLGFLFIFLTSEILVGIGNENYLALLNMAALGIIVGQVDFYEDREAKGLTLEPDFIKN
jgi:hypothetical protein